jgi:hypothetical protein
VPSKRVKAKSAERRRTLDAATILIAYGPDAGAEAQNHAFVSELASDTDAPRGSGSRFTASFLSGGGSL